MAIYAITGKLGSGKGKGSMRLLRDYLRAEKRVATNCDVFMEHMMPGQSRIPFIRIPDKPTANDLYSIGSGNKFIQFDPLPTYTLASIEYTPPSPRLLPGFDERYNGALFLDECASWLNTRKFQEKGRAELLEWAIHARKYGWDVYFICQNIKQIDAQLRESLFEYTVRFSRLDRMKVPFISAGVKLISAGFADGSLPRLHIGVVRLGCSPDGIVADRWYFRGDDLNEAYNTTQVFSDAYPHGTHSVLSAWHLSGKVGMPPDFVGPVRIPADYQLVTPRVTPPKSLHKHMTKFLVVSLIVGLILGAVGTRVLAPTSLSSAAMGTEAVKAIKFSEAISAKGFVINEGFVSVILSDGRVVTPLSFKSGSTGWQAEIEPGVWVKGEMQ